MSDYIKPPYQLPQYAESLHSVDWVQFGKALGEAWATIGKTLADTFAHVAKTLAEGIPLFVDAMADANRDNAYHPTGPVVRTTAYVVSDDQKALPESRES